MRKKFAYLLVMAALAALGLVSMAFAADHPPGLGNTLIMAATSESIKSPDFNQKASDYTSVPQYSIIANFGSKRLKSDVVTYSAPPGDSIIAEVSPKKLFAVPLARLAHPDIGAMASDSFSSKNYGMTFTSIGASSRDAPQPYSGIDTRAAPA